jgi:hypothetical protein
VRFVVLSGIVLLQLSRFTGSASAQGMQMDMGSIVLDGTLLKQTLDRNLGLEGRQKRSASSSRNGSGRAADSSVAPGTNSTRYVASPAVSERVKATFAEALAQRGAISSSEIRAALQKIDTVRAWTTAVEEDGLRPGDVADAVASYWILNWVIATGTRDNTREQVLAVREQVRPLLEASPGFPDFDDERRQDMAETLMLNFLLQREAYLAAAGARDGRLQRTLADAAVARLRVEMGVDLRQLKLTKDGFVPG